ncbi:hypothetical protein IAT38_004018 [Cryptococcus sp. DSM 104549]
MDVTMTSDGTVQSKLVSDFADVAASCDITLVSSDNVRFGAHRSRLRVASNFFDAMFEIGDEPAAHTELVLPDSDLEKADNLALFFDMIYGEAFAAIIFCNTGAPGFHTLDALISHAEYPEDKLAIVERLVLLLVKYDAVHLMYKLGVKLEGLMDEGKLSPLDVFKLGDDTRCLPLSLQVLGSGCHYLVSKELDATQTILRDTIVDWSPIHDAIPGASMFDPTATSLEFYESLPDRTAWCWMMAYHAGSEAVEASRSHDWHSVADEFGRLMGFDKDQSALPPSPPPKTHNPEDDPEIRRVTLISPDRKKFEANRMILLRHCPSFGDRLRNVANTSVSVKLYDADLEKSAHLSLMIDMIHGKKIPLSRLSAPPSLILTEADRAAGHQARKKNYDLCDGVWRLLCKYEAPRETIDVLVQLASEWMKSERLCPYSAFKMALEMDRMDLCVKAVTMGTKWVWDKPDKPLTQSKLRSEMKVKAAVFDVTSFSFNEFVDVPRKASWALLRASRKVPTTVVAPEEIDWVAVRDKYEELMTGNW